MSRQVKIADADSTVDVFRDAEGEPIRLRFGLEPDGLTIVGNLHEIHRLVIEADRLISGLVVRTEPPS